LCINPDVVTQHHVIIAKGNGIDAQIGFYVFLRDSNDKLEFQLFTSTSQNNQISSTTTLVPTKWYHVVCTKGLLANRDQMKIYIDGVLETTGAVQAITGNILNNDNLTIGAESDGGQPTDGQLDDVRIYNRELTLKEAKALFDQSSSGIDFISTNIQWKLGDGKVTDISNLISLYKFDQTVLDSKSSNDGNVFGTEQYTDFKYNTKGFDFDGSTHVQVPESGFSAYRTTTQAKSMTCWINTTSSATQSIFYKIIEAGSPGLYFFITAGQLGYAEIITLTTDELDVRTLLQTLDDGNDHFIGVSYDGGQDETDVHLFIDGDEMIGANRNVENDTLTTANYAANYQPTIGGRLDGTVPLTGKMDDVRLYDRSLTAVEHKRLFEATDSGIDRVRDDNISTRELEIDFNHKNHYQSLKKIAKELGKNLYFNSTDFRVFIKDKGKEIKPRFDTVVLTKPSFNIENVSNVVNIIGNEKDGVQKEGTFEESPNTIYSYEETFTDKDITTDDSLNLIGSEVLSQLKDLNPDLKLTTTPDQINRYDLQVGDELNMNEISQDLQGLFKIVRISSGPVRSILSLSKSNNTIVQTAGVDISTLISDLMSAIQDIQIETE